MLKRQASIWVAMIRKELKQKLRFACAGAGALFLWYSAGPILLESSRYIYTQSYYLCYGGPSVWDIYGFYTMRGHISGIAYQYGHAILSCLMAPIFAKIPDWLIADDAINKPSLSVIKKNTAPNAMCTITPSAPTLLFSRDRKISNDSPRAYRRALSRSM